MKKNNKAFTLIELLAIIVILAIIAVITIPIILNVIENSRKGAAIDSAYGYKDAISKYYVSNMIENQDISLDGFYLVENGKLKKGNDDSNPIEILFSGTAPSKGNLVINKGSVEAGCLILDDYKITILNDKINTTGKGKCYGIPVYYDVKEGKECDSTSNSEGCMKWYIYDADERTYTMIMDHNILKTDVSWATVDVSPSEVGITYPNGLPSQKISGSNNIGPLAVLKQLKDVTDSWNGVEIPISYTTKWTCENLENPSSCDGYVGVQQYTIDYNKYKARLISAEEVNEITGLGTNNSISDSFFDSNCSVSKECNSGKNIYGWLFDHTGIGVDSIYAPNCTDYGCNVGESSDLDGYWTSSPSTSNYYGAWSVNYYGRMQDRNAGKFGIRPVIRVSKSKFLSE